MKNLSLVTVGAACAVLTAVAFVAGAVLLSSSGVEDLIPQANGDVLKWMADVEENRDPFVGGGWLIVFAGLFGIVALVGFYEALRDAGPVLIIAPVASSVGLTLVTISHAIPLAMAYKLAPGYVQASESTRAALAVTAETFAMVCLVLNYIGNVLGWGVAVPIFAIAILKTSTLPKWIGWLGLIVALFAGWLGLLSPASDTVEGISSIGFVGFFVWMASMGVALLLRQRRTTIRAAP